MTYPFNPMTLTPTGGKKECCDHHIDRMTEWPCSCKCHSTPEVVQEDWEREFLSVYSKKNEWKPDASPLDVTAFISSLIKAKEEAARHEGWENGMNSMGVESLKEQLRDEGRLEILDRVNAIIDQIGHTAVDLCANSVSFKEEVLTLLSSLRENEKDITKSNL